MSTGLSVIRMRGLCVTTRDLFENCFSVFDGVFDEELVGFSLKALEGIPVDDDRLCVDSIKRVGFGGNFMTEEATLKYLRSDYYETKILNRLSREDWEKAGSKDINACAKERITKLMKEHQPDPLDSGNAKELEALVNNMK